MTSTEWRVLHPSVTPPRLSSTIASVTSSSWQYYTLLVFVTSTGWRIIDRKQISLCRDNKAVDRCIECGTHRSPPPPPQSSGITSSVWSPQYNIQSRWGFWRRQWRIWFQSVTPPTQSSAITSSVSSPQHHKQWDFLTSTMTNIMAPISHNTTKIISNDATNFITALWDFTTTTKWQVPHPSVTPPPP